MPLTGAERTRKYREKLKQERPEEYELQKKRNLNRIKSNKKKVAEMTVDEVEKQRDKWRQEKRNSRAATKMHVVELLKENSIMNVEPEVSDDKTLKTIEKLKHKCRSLTNKLRRTTTHVSKWKTVAERYKKRYNRLKAANEKEIEDLNLNVLKLKTREEVLEATLKTTYQQSKTNNEKLILKKLIHNSANKSIISTMIGLQNPRIKKKKVRRNGISEITNFYIRDDITRNTSGKKETKTKKKQKMQRRFLLDTLVNTYKKYRSEGGKYGFTMFYKHKPFYVLSPSVQSRDTCLCIKHSNIEFKHTVLKRLGLVNNNIKESLDRVACDTTNYLCMHNICDKCNKCNMPFNNNQKHDALQEVEWYEWNRVDHKYMKKGDSTTEKEVTTKKTAKVKHTGSLQDLKDKYNDNLQQFKKHYYNMIHQQKQYQKAIADLKKNEALIVCDFSENYEAKLAQEIQSMHFGASKCQITLHTGMIFWKEHTQSFVTISGNNSHQPPAIWAHLDPVIKIIKQETPDVKIIHFYSDGPSSQYRQKHNFFLLTYFTKHYEFEYTTWSFFESGHGKNVADGIGGCVKRALDRKVSYGIDVKDAMDAYEVLNQSLKAIKVFLIFDYEIDEIQKLLPIKVPILKGSMQLHQVITSETDNTKLTYRNISCFCGPHRGQCQCFFPQTHFVTNIDNQNARKSKELFPPILTAKKNYKVSQRKSQNLINFKDLPSSSAALESYSYNSTNSKDLLLLASAAKQDLHVAAADMHIRGRHNNENAPIEKQRSTDGNNIKFLFDTDNTESYESDNFSDAMMVDMFLKDTSEVVQNTCPFSENMSNIKLLDTATEPKNVREKHKLDDITDMPIVILPQNDKILINKNVVEEKPKNKASYKEIKIRSFPECQKCSCSILGKKGRCSVCKKLYCLECIGAPAFFDYICDACLEGDVSD